jgi:hypothetical protein
MFWKLTLAVIAPAGFEASFAELAEAGEPGRRQELATKYGVRRDLLRGPGRRADLQAALSGILCSLIIQASVQPGPILRPRWGTTLSQSDRLSGGSPRSNRDTMSARSDKQSASLVCSPFLGPVIMQIIGSFVQYPSAPSALLR